MSENKKGKSQSASLKTSTTLMAMKDKQKLSRHNLLPIARQRAIERSENSDKSRARSLIRRREFIRGRSESDNGSGGGSVEAPKQPDLPSSPPDVTGSGDNGVVADKPKRKRKARKPVSRAKGARVSSTDSSGNGGASSASQPAKRKKRPAKPVSG